MVKVRGRFQEGDVVYRGNAGDSVLISKGERVGVAQDLYYGEVTTFKLSDTGVKYILVRIEPNGNEIVTEVPSP